MTYFPAKPRQRIQQRSCDSINKGYEEGVKASARSQLARKVRRDMLHGVKRGTVDELYRWERLAKLLVVVKRIPPSTKPTSTFTTNSYPPESREPCRIGQLFLATGLRCTCCLQLLLPQETLPIFEGFAHCDRKRYLRNGKREKAEQEQQCERPLI